MWDYLTNLSMLSISLDQIDIGVQCWHIAGSESGVDNMAMNVETGPTGIPRPTINIVTSVDAVDARIASDNAAHAMPWMTIGTLFYKRGRVYLRLRGHIKRD